VPPQAVLGAGPDTHVMVRTSTSATPQRRAVVIGRVAPMGVEIVSGLKPGETVLWEAAAAQP